jgi:hypothetical protein
MTPRRPATRQPRKDTRRSGARDAGGTRAAVEHVAGFVPLTALTQGAPDPAAAFAQIRAIYFNTTKRTIHADLAHAIELLKSLPSEEAREKATVYMEGLAQMRREWARKG